MANLMAQIPQEKADKIKSYIIKNQVADGTIEISYVHKTIMIKCTNRTAMHILNYIYQNFKQDLGSVHVQLRGNNFNIHSGEGYDD